MLTTKRTVSEILRSVGACNGAVAWAEPYGTDGTKAWRECDNPEWMLWLLGKLSGEPGSKSRRKLVGCCASIAELVLPIFEQQCPGDSRVRNCIEVCRRHATGKATLKEVNAAGDDAWDAASAAGDAARAAWDAAVAAGDDAWDAASAAGDAARAAWDAAVAAVAAARAARAVMKNKICDLIRQQYHTLPDVPEETKKPAV